MADASLGAKRSIAESSSRRRSKKNFLDLSGLSVAARERLSMFDINGDGNLDPSEISQIVETLANEQFRGRHLKYGFLALALVAVLLIGCMFGISWAVFLANKDTEVRQGVLVTRSDKVPIQLGNSQMTVVDGMLSSRGATNVTVSTTPSTVERPLNADMSAAQLTSLTRVYLRGSDAAQVGLRVTGFWVLAGSPPMLLLSTPSGSLAVSGNTVTGSATTTLMGDVAVVWQEVTGVFTH